MPENASGGISSSSSLLIRSENPRRRQAENPLMPLSEFARPALQADLRRDCTFGLLSRESREGALQPRGRLRVRIGGRIVCIVLETHRQVTKAASGPFTPSCSQSLSL